MPLRTPFTPPLSASLLIGCSAKHFTLLDLSKRLACSDHGDHSKPVCALPCVLCATSESKRCNLFLFQIGKLCSRLAVFQFSATITAFGVFRLLWDPGNSDLLHREWRGRKGGRIKALKNKKRMMGSKKKKKEISFL